jgi:hypothetical protein
VSFFLMLELPLACVPESRWRMLKKCPIQCGLKFTVLQIELTRQIECTLEFCLAS